MRILISGASGLIGTELKKQLITNGMQPLSLVRREARDETEISWDPQKHFLTPGVIDTIDAVINLAGATTGKIPWTKKYKTELIQSRLDSTKTLVDAINGAKNPPKVLVSGSASGIYGDRGDEVLNEESSKGTGFLSDLAFQWEEQANQANCRVVLVRTTLVMSPTLGALGKLIPLIKAFIGGPLGSGKQWWAWISLHDEARAIRHLIDNENTSGAYNLTAPEPATAKELVDAVARGFQRPSWLRVPGWAMQMLIGEAARELLLCSQKMTADKLLATGFEFDHPTLNQSVRYVVSGTA